MNFLFSKAVAAAAEFAVIVLAAARADAAVVASVVGTTLTIAGDGLDNQINVYVDLNDATKVVVYDGAAVVGTFARAAFNAITADAGGGNDHIWMIQRWGWQRHPQRGTMDTTSCRSSART
jgi:hypothetical protein